MLCLRAFSVLFPFVVLLIVQSIHGSEIIDGKEATPHSRPYMALLNLRNNRLCGGVLIDRSWVLTAAHCENVQTVSLGVHSMKEKGKKSRQELKVKMHFPHPCYNSDDEVNDLQLLKLKKSAKKTNTVKFLKLPTSNKDPVAGSVCQVAGWGLTKNNARQPSDVLMEVNVTVIDRQKCNSPDYYNSQPVITSGMICAGSNGQNNADTCKGDSGGPLLCGRQLVGITSFGKDCGRKNKPGVYAFLSKKQLDWIKQTMKKAEI